MKPREFLRDIFPALKAIRQDLHRHPELGFHEVRTSGIIAQQLSQFGISDVKRNIGVTGVLATIKGTKHGETNTRTVGLRADIDALPMEDEGDQPYKSIYPGRAHKCGHDLHTTTLLVSLSHQTSNMRFQLTPILLITGSCCVSLET